MLDGGGDAAFELVVIVAVEQVMLAVVLVLDHGIHRGEAIGEQLSFAVALHTAAIGVAAPVEIDIGQIAAFVPDFLVDHGLKPGAVSARFRSEHAGAGAAGGLCFGLAIFDQFRGLGAVALGGGVVAQRFVERHHRACGAVDQVDLLGEGIAEEAGDAQGHVHARAAEFGHGHHLEADHAARSPVPARAHAHQRQSLRDVIAAGAHVGGAPCGKGHGLGVLALALEVVLHQQIGGLAAEFPGDGGGHGAGIDRIEVAPRGKHIGPSACGRARRSGQDEAAVETGQQGFGLARTAEVDAGGEVSADGVEDGQRPVPRSAHPELVEGCWRGAVVLRQAQDEREWGRFADPFRRQQFEPFHSVAMRAPWLFRNRCKRFRSGALPTITHPAVERVEVQTEVLRHRPQQRGLSGMVIATRRAGQRHQQVTPQAAFGRLGEDMQTIADLQFLQFAEVIVDGRKRIVIVTAGPRVTVETMAARQIENVAPQPVEAARVHPGGEVVFVHQRLKLLERAIGFGAGQRRGEVVDDHRADAALGLRAFAGVVDDEGVKLRQRPGADLRETLARERDRLAGQPFQIAVLADMDHRLRAEVLRQPDVKGEVGVRRRQGGIVIAGLGIDVIAARGLHGDGEIAEAVDRQAERAVPHEGIGGWRAPAFGHGLARTFGHGCESGFVD